MWLVTVQAVTRLWGGSEVEGRPCDFTAAVRLRDRERQKECVYIWLQGVNECEVLCCWDMREFQVSSLECGGLFLIIEYRIYRAVSWVLYADDQETGGTGVNH